MMDAFEISSYIINQSSGVFVVRSMKSMGLESRVSSDSIDPAAFPFFAAPAPNPIWHISIAHAIPAFISFLLYSQLNHVYS